MRFTTLLKRPSVRSVLPILAATVASLLAAPDLAVSLGRPATTSTAPHPDWTASADSEQSNESPASNAIDGNPNTMWHTQYAPTAAPLPHTLTIDMHATNIVAGLRYQPRTDHPNGRIGSYEIHLSGDGTTWGNPVATGTFADNTTEQFVSFAPTTAQYVRLTALSEAGNRGPWSSAAEVNLVLNPVPTLPRVGWTVAADSAQPGEGPASNAIDGNPNTLWHTQYAPTAAPLPHTLTIDMHATNTVSGLRYRPRTDHPNGRIGGYQIHLSTDGTTWGNPVATGTFLDDSSEQSVFFTPKATRYVRLTALTEAGGRGPYSAAAEINLTNNPLSALQCSPRVPIYATRSDQRAFVQHQHLEPETGVSSWGSAQQINAWGDTARHIAGPDGVIYAATSNGELRRMRWSGTTWMTFPGGLNYEILDANPVWARYPTPEYINRISVDSEGDIYTIEPDGWLHWRKYDSTARTWAHRLVKRSSADLIVAAGPGVIYARSSGQRLSRFEYHAESQRSRHWGVGKGWDAFSQIFSPGGDVLYAIRADTGDLVWYRYNPDAYTWANGRVDDVPLGARVGTGWQSNYETVAAPDSCRLSGTNWQPTRPEVTPRPLAPVTLMLSTNGHLHYSYVDSEGRAIYAEAAELAGGTPIRLAAIPGMTGLTGSASTAETQQGRIQFVGNGHDAEVSSSIQTIAGGTWGPVETLGGFFNTTPTIVSSDSRIVVAYAIDSNGFAWIRKPMCAEGPLYPWYIRDLGGPSTLRLRDQSPLTVVRTPNGMRLVGQDRNGAIYTRNDYRVTLGENCDGLAFPGPGLLSDLVGWTNLGGSGFIGSASAVLMPNETVQVFAAGLDGVIYIHRDTWTAVSAGITANGPPSAILAPDGKIKIVVRGTDGFIYYTSQTTPDATTFDQWLAIPDTDEAGTDPTALAVPGSNTWVVAYRTDLDVPRLRRYVPGVPAAPTTMSSSFVDVPMTPPAG